MLKKVNFEEKKITKFNSNCIKKNKMKHISSCPRDDVVELSK